MGSTQKRRYPQIAVGVCLTLNGADRLAIVFIDEVFASGGGVATREQLLSVLSRKTLAAHVKAGAIIRLWHGIMR